MDPPSKIMSTEKAQNFKNTDMDATIEMQTRVSLSTGGVRNIRSPGMYTKVYRSSGVCFAWTSRQLPEGGSEQRISRHGVR